MELPNIARGDIVRFEAGSQFAGYTVEARLGRGGMATVYLVREAGIDRLVALKVLPEQLSDDAQFAARFEQEARVIGSLDHPHIIPLYRYGITDEIPWMALRYVDGGDFGMRLAARPLAVQEGLAILKGVAAALDYAHRKGVIHRDLKPQNILLTNDGAVYLADFGVAKMLEGSAILKTSTGSIVGTPAYMAPEQAQGLQLGSYTDVYALAVMCFAWLTGKLPFDADTPHAVLMKHVRDPVPAEALRMLSAPVADVLLRGLAKNPEQRIQAASVLIAALDHALCAPATHATDIIANPVSVQATASQLAGGALAVDDVQPKSIVPTPAAPSDATPASPRAVGSTRSWKLGVGAFLILAAGISAYVLWRPIAVSTSQAVAAPSDQLVPRPEKAAAPAPPAASKATSSLLDGPAGQRPGIDFSTAHIATVILSGDGKSTIDDPDNLTSQDFATVDRSANPFGEAQVEFKLTPEGAQKMLRLSTAHVGRPMAFVINGDIDRAHAAVIQGPMSDRMAVNFPSAGEADSFLMGLRETSKSRVSATPTTRTDARHQQRRDATEAPASADEKRTDVAKPARPTRAPPSSSTVQIPAATPAQSPVADAVPPKPTQVTAEPRLLHRVEPIYPDRALRRGVSGFAVVAFTINADGSVSGASVASSDPPGEFDSAALKAVGKWRYTAPGQPVSKHVKITFKLPED